MKPVAANEILPLEKYESRRASIRKSMIALKGRRRIFLPPAISIVFENRKTAWYQIQEMLRAERIVKSAAVRHELKTYNDLVPKAGCLRATLFIEIPELHKLKDGLDKFKSLPSDGSLYLQIGEHRIEAEFDPEQYSEERVAAVQYITFKIPPAARELLKSKSGASKGSIVSLVCDHSANRAKVALSDVALREVRDDLAPESPRTRRTPTK